MRSRAAATVSFVVLMLGACLAFQPAVLNASAGFDIPEMLEGDFWKYNTAFSAGALGFEGTIEFEMRGVEDVPVGGAAVQAKKITLTGGGTYEGDEMNVHYSGGWTVSGTGYYAEADHRLLSVVEDLEMDGSWQFSGMSGAMSSTVHNSSTYEFVSSTLEYPIEGGDSGESNYTITATSSMHTEMTGAPNYDYYENNEYNETMKFSCLKVEKVTVPAGTFEGYLVKLEYRDGRSAESWYAPEVGESVKNVYYDRNGTWLGTDELTSYRYKGSSPTDSDDQLLVMVLFALTVAVAVLILIIVLRMRKRPVPAAVPGQDGATSALDADKAGPLPPDEMEKATVRRIPVRRKPTRGRSNARFGCIALMVAGVLVIVLGMSLMGIEETRSELIGYHVDDAYYGSTPMGIQSVPLYGEYTAFPYFVHGLVIIVLGTVLLMAGYALFNHNEKRIGIDNQSARTETKL